MLEPYQIPQSSISLLCFIFPNFCSVYRNSFAMIEGNCEFQSPSIVAIYYFERDLFVVIADVTRKTNVATLVVSRMQTKRSEVRNSRKVACSRSGDSSGISLQKE